MNEPSAAVLKMCARGLHYWAPARPEKGSLTAEPEAGKVWPLRAYCIDCGITYAKFHGLAERTTTEPT